jgi:tungstate transport system substrate-binding protein
MKRIKETVTFGGLIILLATLIGLSTASAQQKNVILATTTSTQDSGLLDVLIPIFEKDTGFFVKTISVGSGQAMKMGEKGEADVLLVHSPAAEKAFVDQGFGINRMLVMHNDFIIVGPPADPAKIKDEITRGPEEIANPGPCSFPGDNSDPFQRKGSESGRELSEGRNGFSRPDSAWTDPQRGR